MTGVQGKWIGAYRKKDALWIHDDNPHRPHALLTSGKHSNGFFNSRRVIPDEALLAEAAFDLMIALARHARMNSFDVVVGPQTGATKLAELLANVKKEYFEIDCTFASPAKHEDQGVKSMVFMSDEAARLQSKRVLLCEDVISTGGSIELTAEAVKRAKGVVQPYVCTLVNRSGQTTIGRRRIVALINREMPMWDQDECPLCKLGSKAIPAKDPKNWALLNATS